MHITTSDEKKQKKTKILILTEQLTAELLLVNNMVNIYILAKTPTKSGSRYWAVKCYIGACRRITIITYENNLLKLRAHPSNLGAPKPREIIRLWMCQSSPCLITYHHVI